MSPKGEAGESESEKMMTETGKEKLIKSEHTFPVDMRPRKCPKLEIKSEDDGINLRILEIMSPKGEAGESESEKMMTEMGKEKLIKSEYTFPVDMRPRKCPKLEIKSEEEGINLPILEIMSPKNEIDANVKQELDDEGYDSCDSSRDSNSPSQDDGAAHFTFQQLPYESIAGNYNILVYRHEGTSANILDCYCLPKRIICVVKVFHGTQMFSTKALNEINTLELLAKHDNAGKHFVKMLDSFKYGNRTHIALDRLGWSLQWYLVRRCYRRRFTVYAICKLGRQMLESVALMHDLHLIHTDLKPEHLLFPSDNFNLSRIYKAGTGSRKELDFLLPIPSPFSLKLIDFTSTIYEQDKQYHSNIVSTRQYRAPEVILGLGWSYPCDVWSVGCILAELYVGKILFDRTDDDDLQHLALMERMLGKFPSHMLEKTLHPVGKYFKNGRLNLPKNLTRAVMGLRPVRELFPSDVSGFKADFLNLLQGLLQLDPSERLTARDALGHPFFTKKEDA